MTITTPTNVKTRSAAVTFVLDLSERAVKTAAQAAIAVYGGAGLNVWHFPWHESVGVIAGATVMSVLTSLASVNIGNKNSASLVK